MDTRKLIGWNLRKLRVEQGLSQERLALDAAIDRSYVGRIERGEENLTISVLDSLAASLGVRVSAFFDEVGISGSLPSGLRAGRKPRNS